MNAPKPFFPLKYEEDTTTGDHYLRDCNGEIVARFIIPNHAVFIEDICNTYHDTENEIKKLRDRITRAAQEIEEIEDDVFASRSGTAIDLLRELAKDLRGERQEL